MALTDQIDSWDVTHARAVCAELGVEPTDTNVEQMAVMLAAFEIFQERNKVRRDLWEGDSMQEASLHCVSKSRRMQHHTQVRGINVRPEMLDDALDLINYAVFYARKV